MPDPNSVAGGWTALALSVTGGIGAVFVVVRFARRLEVDSNATLRRDLEATEARLRDAFAEIRGCDERNNRLERRIEILVGALRTAGIAVPDEFWST